MARTRKLRSSLICAGMLFLTGAHVLRADSCLSGTDFVYVGHASRYSATNVNLFSVGTVMGTYAESWDVDVYSREQLNGADTGYAVEHVSTTQASNSWTVNPAVKGWGQWGIATRFHAIPHSGCSGPPPADVTPTWFVAATQPYVTDPNGNTSNVGIWWLGLDGAGASLSDSNNGYFASGAVYANTGGAPESPTWSISGARASALTLASSWGLSNTVTAVGHSTSYQDIQIGFTVGGVSAVPLMYTANYPSSLEPPTSADNVSYGIGYGPGYDTKYSYVLHDFLNNALPTIAVNETLILLYYQAGATWLAVPSRSYPRNFEATYYMVDHITYYPSQDDSDPRPSVLSPWDPNASTGPVEQWTQEWRVGCCSDVNEIGYGLFLQSDTMQRNRGNGRVTGIQHIQVP